MTVFQSFENLAIDNELTKLMPTRILAIIMIHILQLLQIKIIEYE